MTGEMKGSTSAKELCFLFEMNQRFARRRAADWSKDKTIAMRYGHCSCLNSIGDGALTFNQTGTR